MNKGKIRKLNEEQIPAFDISKVPGNEPHYRTYAIKLNDKAFTIRKRSNLIWVDSHIVEQHGDDLLNCIGCYIDENLKKI